MLRIIESQSAAQAKSYYSTADYYTEGQELAGEWRGRGADRLGLHGTIRSADWDALCDNRHPESGEGLTVRTRQERRVGYDYNFHAPKGVSLLHALTEDDRILTAFQDAVRETMAEMESEMQTRVRRSGQNRDRTTGNMIWGEFVHQTARPVDAIPDPHLHSHCFVFNQTWDSEEGRWKAGQFGDLKRDAPYFEARFHVRLAEKLGELGLRVERTRTGWDLAGLAPGLVEKFSRRTQEIEELAHRKGITDPERKAELGAKTRSRKAKHFTMSELRDEWRSRLTDDERESLAQVAEQIGQSPVPDRPEQAIDPVRWASDHCFERKSVLPERVLQAESFRRAVGTTGIEAVEKAFHGEPFLIRERYGRRMVTTATVLAEEQRMLSFAREGKGTQRPFSRQPHSFQREWLNDDQRNAVNHVLQSRDRVVLIRGAAGVGKTSMMQEAVEAIEQTGRRVFTFAPSAQASRGVLREKGFADADTVARLLQDVDLQQRLRGQVIWIDEAGQVGSRTMAQVFGIADQQQARVVLSGDRRQHGSVERGAALRLLEEQAGLIPAEIREILRQSRQYKQAVQDLSEDRFPDGFRRLNDLGWIVELPQESREATLARDYIETRSAGQSVLVVSPSHREGNRVTASIRDQLRQRGHLAPESLTVPILHRTDMSLGEREDAANYHPGDVLVFHQNAKRFTKGQRVTVDSVPPVDQAARYQVYRSGELEIASGETLRITQNGKTADGNGRLHNGELLHVSGFDERGNILTEEKKTIPRDFGHLSYGYVVTSHASQGSDVDRVIIAQSADSFPASSKEQFYVSVSRGRKSAMIYTEDKSALLDAVQRSEERLSAIELLSADMIERISSRPPTVRMRENIASVRQQHSLQDWCHER